MNKSRPLNLDPCESMSEGLHYVFKRSHEPNSLRQLGLVTNQHENGCAYWLSMTQLSAFQLQIDCISCHSCQSISTYFSHIVLENEKQWNTSTHGRKHQKHSKATQLSTHGLVVLIPLMSLLRSHEFDLSLQSASCNRLWSTLTWHSFCGGRK